MIRRTDPVAESVDEGGESGPWEITRDRHPLQGTAPVHVSTEVTAPDDPGFPGSEPCPDGDFLAFTGLIAESPSGLGAEVSPTIRPWISQTSQSRLRSATPRSFGSTTRCERT